MMPFGWAYVYGMTTCQPLSSTLTPRHTTRPVHRSETNTWEYSSLSWAGGWVYMTAYMVGQYVCLLPHPAPSLTDNLPDRQTTCLFSCALSPS